jgi:hypothetical protein
VALVVAPIALFVWAFYFYDGRKDIDLASWAEPQDAWTGAMMPGARWATDELCGPDFPCIQAVTSDTLTSDTLTMYRFERREFAVVAADHFGEDGYLTGWIAVRYAPGGLTASQREDFEYGISCINTWVGEEGQDC